MKSWKRYRGSVLQGYLKKGIQSLSSNSMVNFMLWRQLRYFKNWDDKISLRPTTSQKAGLSPPCVLFFSKRSYWYFLTSLSRWYILVFSFISIAPIFVNLFYLIISKRTGTDPWYSKLTPSPRHNWIVWLVLKEYPFYLQKITLTSFNFLMALHEKKENRGKIKATSIFVLRHA